MVNLEIEESEDSRQDPVDRRLQLEKLMDNRLISQEEYIRKREEIISRL